MKKILLSAIAALSISSTMAMAYDTGNGDWYYSPKRYVDSYLFSIDIMGQNIQNAGTTFELGLSSRYIDYFGNSDFNWGVLGNLEFTALKAENMDDEKVGRVNLDIGPTLGYNITKKTNAYITAGYSGYYMRDSDGNDKAGGTPYYGGGLSYFFNDDMVFTVAYKVKTIDEDNYWKFPEDQNQLIFGLRITYR